MQLTGKSAGYAVAALGWATLGVGLTLDHAQLRFGASIATVGGWVIASGLALAVIGATERGFGALDRFFAEILARTRRQSPRIEPTFDAFPEAARSLVAPPAPAAPARAARVAAPPAPFAPQEEPRRALPLGEPLAMNEDLRRLDAVAEEARQPAQEEPVRRAPRQEEPRRFERQPEESRRPAPLREEPRRAYAAAYAQQDEEDEAPVLLRRDNSAPAPARRPAPAPQEVAREPRPSEAVYPLDAPQPARLRPQPAANLTAPGDAAGAPRMLEGRAPARAPTPLPGDEELRRSFGELLDWAAQEARSPARSPAPRASESERPQETLAAKPPVAARTSPAARPAYHPAPATPANFDAPRASVIEEGEIAGHAYRVLADLTVELDTLLGPRAFDSMEAARRFVGAPSRAPRARSVA